MSWYESLLWLYLIGAGFTALYILQLLLRKAPATTSIGTMCLFTIENSLLWPLLFIQFIIWCKQFTQR